MLGLDGADVYLRQAGAHVDRPAEYDGEVLSMLGWMLEGYVVGEWGGGEVGGLV